MSSVSQNEIKKYIKNLKFLRHSAGWTQEELAKKVGVTRQTITAIENKKLIPSVTLFLAIAGIFVISSSSNPIVKGVSQATGLDKIFGKVLKD